MSKKTVIVGNWKMNKLPVDAKTFMDSLNQELQANKDKVEAEFGIAVPSINLETVAKNAPEGMIIAAQDASQYSSGAYTGELSVEMIKAVGANAVVLGHSERREYHGETDAVVNAKIKAALAGDITPILCVGETKDERESNTWKKVLENQLKGGLEGLSESDVSKIIIAYEPIWAIGTGLTASADQAEEACAHVRDRVAAEVSQPVADDLVIQYGGSVKPENVAELMSKSNINGALVGGASLDPSSYIKLLTLNK